MRLDVRVPIGLLFTIFGLILAAFGLFSNPALYERSLGININLKWGIVMFIFGIIMLLISKYARSHQL
jgi:multisubunit Na+/H+ antiporter MnhG subunit